MIQKYHCVTQLWEDSWEYRLKRPGDEPNDDDLVAWEDYLMMSDRLTIEKHDLDKHRIAQIEDLRVSLAAAWRERDELKRRLADKMVP